MVEDSRWTFPNRIATSAVGSDEMLVAQGPTGSVSDASHRQWVFLVRASTRYLWTFTKHSRVYLVDTSSGIPRDVSYSYSGGAHMRSQVGGPVARRHEWTVYSLISFAV